MTKSRIGITALLCLTFFACAESPAPTTQSDAESEDELLSGFEVWLLDQSNSNSTFGGRVYVYPGHRLSRIDPSDTQPSAVIDLGADASTLCLNATGANPVRPHMIFFNSNHSHAIISFVASGHVLIVDAASRTPVSCLRMSVGTGGARQAHAAVPDPFDRYIVVANQNGKVLERIDTNYSTNTFTHNVAAALDLANCTTPNGVACQLAGVRPDNAPICPIVDSEGDFTWVTLRGGGLFVVDANQTPMQIVGEYDNTNVHGNGCGGVQTHNRMWIDSGGALATNLTEFDVYRFPLNGYSASNPPNTPARELVFTDDGNTTIERDAHGMVTTFFGLHVWVYDRASNRAEVFRASDGAHLNTVPLAHSSATDPTPDLSDIGPWWNTRQFISLRGPTPLTGDPHISTGSTPGLGIMQMDLFGVSGQLISILPITNPDPANPAVERADGHGVRVRRL